MKAKLENVRRIESSEGMTDGKYPGVWGGYAVKFETPTGTYEGRSTVGVRGMNIPCTVTVECGQCTVAVRKHETGEDRP